MKWRWMFFGVVALAALAVPAWMIATQERVLAQGEVFRFRMRPVDPYDPFRGRYMALAYAENSAPAPGVPRERLYRRNLYAIIVVDEDGFATIESLAADPPAEGPYVKVRTWGHREEGAVRFELPFDRYYLREDLAPRAEALLRKRLRPPEPERPAAAGGEPEEFSPEAFEAMEAQRTAPIPGVYVTVRILDGHAALEELWVDGQPILDYLAEHEAPSGG